MVTAVLAGLPPAYPWESRPPGLGTRSTSASPATTITGASVGLQASNQVGRLPRSAARDRPPPGGHLALRLGRLGKPEDTARRAVLLCPRGSGRAGARGGGRGGRPGGGPDRPGGSLAGGRPARLYERGAWWPGAAAVVGRPRARPARAGSSVLDDRRTVRFHGVVLRHAPGRRRRTGGQSHPPAAPHLPGSDRRRPASDHALAQ